MSLVIVLFGAISMGRLQNRQFPDVDPPVVSGDHGVSRRRARGDRDVGDAAARGPAHRHRRGPAPHLGQPRAGFGDHGRVRARPRRRRGGQRRARPRRAGARRSPRRRRGTGRRQARRRRLPDHVGGAVRRRLLADRPVDDRRDGDPGPPRQAARHLRGADRRREALLDPRLDRQRASHGAAPHRGRRPGGTAAGERRRPLRPHRGQRSGVRHPHARRAEDAGGVRRADRRPQSTASRCACATSPWSRRVPRTIASWCASTASPPSVSASSSSRRPTPSTSPRRQDRDREHPRRSCRRACAWRPPSTPPSTSSARCATSVGRSSRRSCWSSSSSSSSCAACAPRSFPPVAIPVSLVGTFAVLYFLDFSINTLTLMGMTLAIGLVVDDAIVVLENVTRWVEQGTPPLQAARRGMDEIAFAVVAATVADHRGVPAARLSRTTRPGRLFREFGITVAAAVAISGFVALTLSPMLCARILRQRPGGARPARRARPRRSTVLSDGYALAARTRPPPPRPRPLRRSALGGPRRPAAAHRADRVHPPRRPGSPAHLHPGPRGQHHRLHRPLPGAGRGDRARHAGGRQGILGRRLRHRHARRRQRRGDVRHPQAVGGTHAIADAGRRRAARQALRPGRHSRLSDEPAGAHRRLRRRPGVARPAGSGRRCAGRLRRRDRQPRPRDSRTGERAQRSGAQQAADRGTHRPRTRQRSRRLGARDRHHPAGPVRRARPHVVQAARRDLRRHRPARPPRPRLRAAICSASTCAAPAAR